MLFETLDKGTLARLTAALSRRYGCDETATAVEAAILADWKGAIVDYETDQAVLQAIKSVPPVVPPVIN